MAKLWALTLALLFGAGVWAAPAMAGPNDAADLGDIQRGGGEQPAAAGTLGDAGLKFTSEGFELVMTSRVQFRLTYQNEVGNGAHGANGADFINFRVRRAKTKFSGFIFDKQFKYRLLLNWTSNLVENAVFTWAPSDAINVNGGQDKLNWNWEEYCSSASMLFAERSYTNEVFNEDYAKGVWINGKFGDQTPFLMYWFGVYNGVLKGNNDFRNADGGLTTEVFSQTVDNEMMVNLRLETHPMGEVARKMYDDRASSEAGKFLFAIGLGLNWFTSGFNDTALRPDTVGTPTASGRSRTSQDTLAFTIDGHVRIMGLSVDIAAFFRHTEFHNRGASEFDPSGAAGISNLQDSGITFEIAYFIIPEHLNVGIRANMTNADDFWGGGDTSGQLGIRPDTTEVGVVVNWFLHGDNLKLTFDITYVDQQLTFDGSSTGLLGIYNVVPARSGVLGTHPDNADHNCLWIVRLQIQWIF
jgi:hypothetical protein